MSAPEEHVCPHCGGKLYPWNPPEESTWAHEQRICMNDACSYFVKGWKWMAEKYGTVASYRYRYDTATGAGGSLPVNSPHALREIVDDAPEENP